MSAIRRLVPPRLVCADCGENAAIIEDYKNGNHVCSRCGCVLGDRLIDEGSEWRSFGDSHRGDPSRVGSANNPFLEAEQLDTIISAGQGANSYTLAKIQMKSYMRGPERALKNGLNLITALCERAFIPKTIINRAHHVFKSVEAKRLLKGKNLEGAVGACIYIACKMEDASRTFKEISVVTGVPKREIGRCYKLIAREVDTRGTVPSTDIVARFCADLNFNPRLQRIATDIAGRVHESGILTGRSPDSVAAAVIYLVTVIFPELRDAQRDIQFVTNVTDVTIKNTYKDICMHADEVLPDELNTSKVRERLFKGP